VLVPAARELEPPGHTHAFDMYCRPFHAGTGYLPQTVLSKLSGEVAPYERVALIVLAGLACLGAAFMVLDPRFSIQGWLERAPDSRSGGGGLLDVHVSPQVLGAVALARGRPPSKCPSSAARSSSRPSAATPSTPSTTSRSGTIGPGGFRSES